MSSAAEDADADDAAAWVNVADIVRSTFQFVIDRLKQLHAKLKTLELHDANHQKQHDVLAQQVTTLEHRLAEEQSARARVEHQLAQLAQQVEELTTRALPSKQELSRVLVRKVDTTTLQQALDEVPNRQELASALAELRGELAGDLRSFHDDMARDTQSLLDTELAFMRCAVTSEMLVGRWLFHCDRNGVHSMVESVNTSQVIFQSPQVREEGDGGGGAVRVLKAGVYQVSLCCFPVASAAMEREPLIQLLVDGTVVFSSALGASSQQPPPPPPPPPPYPITAGILNPRPSSSSAYNKYGGRTSAASASRLPLPVSSPYSGWSHVDFLCLPNNRHGSELTIRYRGEKAHGVLTIRNVCCFE